MSETITPQVSDRICKHMNKDHTDAVMVYAQVYAQQPDASNAEMISIDPKGMDLKATINNESVPLRVEFDHELADAKDAHHTLVEMLKQVPQPQANEG